MTSAENPDLAPTSGAGDTADAGKAVNAPPLSLMARALRDYQEAGSGVRLRPPGSPAAILAWERTIGKPLPASVRELYALCDGAEPRSVYKSLRPMQSSELMAHNTQLYAADAPRALRDHEVAYCFTDDEGNYAGPFVSGPLAGCIVLLDASSTRCVPVYWSMQDFIAALAFGLEEDRQWFELPTQFPAFASDVSPAQHARLAKATAELMELAGNSPDGEARHRALSRAVSVVPKSQESVLLEILRHSDDQEVLAFAAEAVGLGRADAATSLLNDIVHRWIPTSATAAIRALGLIHSEASKKCLFTIAQDGKNQWAGTIAGALERCGCTVQRHGSGYTYFDPVSGQSGVFPKGSSFKPVMG